MPTYTPPLGGVVELILEGAYTAPLGNAVELRIEDETTDQLLLPSGFDATEFGLSELIPTQLILGIGFESVYFGITDIRPDGYIPPLGGNVTIVIGDIDDDPYTPPGGNAVQLTIGPIVAVSQDLVAVGFDDSQFGLADVQNFTRYVAADGWSDDSYGTADLYGKPPPWDILVSGFESLAIGMGTGGDGFIAFRIRYLLGAGGIFDPGTGTPLISGGVRELNLSSVGIGNDVYGSALVAYAERELFPSGFPSMVLGAPMVGRQIDVGVSGWDSLEFGGTDVLDNHQELYAFGIEGTTGIPFVALAVRSVFTANANEPDEYRFGRPLVYNQTRYITQLYDEAYWNEGGVGQDAHIYNRNRVIDLVINGIAPPFRQIPLFHEARNNARLIEPPGLDELQFPRQDVSHFNRAIYPVGYVRAESMTEFNVVFNAADQVLIAGFDALGLGNPTLQNTRRYFPFITAGEFSEYGTAFIAPAIRTIVADRPPAPWVGDVPEPSVWFANRTITPAEFGNGFPPTAFGVAALDERFNRVWPNSWVTANRWGESQVRNVTPQIYPYFEENGHTVFGVTGVRNQFEQYDIDGFISSLFGQTQIADRTFTVQVPGILGFRANLLHRVANQLPDPPGPQYIIVNTGIDDLSIPFPMIDANSIYPIWLETEVFGNASVASNGLYPDSILPPWDDNNSQLGKPSLNRPWRISPKSFNEEYPVVEIPRISPHTVWAPQGAPMQAVQNHGNVYGEIIDQYLLEQFAATEMPIWGALVVTNKNRTVQAFTMGDSARFGDSEISTNPQYVRPSGLLSFKWGFPATNRAGDTFVIGEDFADFGLAVVSIPEELVRYIQTTGQLLTQYGTAWVANQHRSIPVESIDAGLVGGAWVQRPPPPALPTGMDATIWGDALVAFRIRTVTARGSDSSVLTWAPGSFAQRMRVLRRNDVSFPGIDSVAWGQARIGDHLQQLSAFGIPEPYQQVRQPRVRGLDRIALGGLGIDSSLEFGDAWAFTNTYGTIRVRGDDWLQLGALNIGAQTLAAEGWDALIHGSTSVDSSIVPSGEDQSEFGIPAMIGTGCGSRVVAVESFEGWYSPDDMVGILEGQFGLAEIET